MDNVTYDSIGVNYNKHRSADIRILVTIKDLLNLPHGSTIADIGAGTGNYANALADSGYKVIAIEPSKNMRNQTTPNKEVTWLSGIAESIPLRNNSVSGVIVILALHHFSDTVCAANELARICPSGPVVVFTIDPRESEEFWFNNYFPEIAEHVANTFPPIADVIKILNQKHNWSVSTTKFLLPRDLKDMNMCSGWNRPEIYLDAEIRQNTSGFALSDPTTVQKGIIHLQSDLLSGNWDRKYGHLRTREAFDAGFKFLKFVKRL